MRQDDQVEHQGEHATGEDGAPNVASVDAFYDSDCPLCAPEVDWLRRHDRGQRVRFVNVAAPDFDAGRDAGMPIDRLQDCIQVRLASGDVLEGPAALRELYAEVIGRDGNGAGKHTPGVSPIIAASKRLRAERRLQRTHQRIADGCVCWRRAG